MSKKVIGNVALGAVLFALCLPAEAQQRTKIPRIGYLGSVSKSDRTETFRQGLRELGYVEGKNIFIEWRHHERNIDRLPALATELVRLKVEIIITAGAPAARAAKGATTTIPIVMTQIGDPVASGFVASLAHPGGNITGLSTLAPELNGKRLEILKEVIPGLSRVGIFGTSTSPDNAPSLKEVELAAKALKLELRYFDILSPKDFESAFRAATKDRAQGALMMVLGTFSSSHRKEIVDLAVKSRLPVIYTGPAMVEAGGLMTYGVDNTHLDRRAAMYVDKILKGAKPADLPVEQPKKFEFVVNLKTAKQMGLTIPPNVLVRADRVIR
jgi:putative ABC transport system substrate-binding protein